MTQGEDLIHVIQLLEAKTWVSDFVRRLASISAKEGHREFASDLESFKLIADDAVETFKVEMVSALRLAGQYPALFKDPFNTLMLKRFEFEDE